MIVGSSILLILLVIGCSNKCHGAELAKTKHLTSMQKEQHKLRHTSESSDVGSSHRLREINSAVQQEKSMVLRSLKAKKKPKPPKSIFEVAQQYESVTVRDNNNIINNDTVIPPDPTGAASLTTLVAVTSHLIEIRTKAGKVIYRESLFTFFKSLNPGSYPDVVLTEPKIIYDEYEDRRRLDVFKNLTLANATAKFLLAVSKDGSPTGRGDWYFQSINSLAFQESPFIANTTEYTWGDYPGFQLGPEAIYLTTNRFSFFTRRFYGTLLYIIRKDSFYGGGQVSYSVNDPFYGKNPVPGLASTPAYIHRGSVGNNIGTFLVCYDGLLDNAGNSLIYVIKVLDPLGLPRFVSTILNLGLIDSPDAADDNLPNAPQLGSTVTIVTDDRRTNRAVWRNGRLWMTMAVKPQSGPNANQSTAYWVEIDTTGNALSVVDQGEIGGEDLGPGTFTFAPSVAVNSRGVVVFGFSASGPSIYPGAYVVGRMPNDLPGTVSKSFVVHEGLDFYNRTDGTPRNRWGDYNGAVSDPSDDSFWLFNEYAGKRGVILNSLFPDEDGVWATAWRRFRSTDCSDDNTGTFYVAELDAYKNCAWLNGAHGGKGHQPNYKETFCQPVAKYKTVRLLCAQTCGVCKE